jgi:hypothetical protein
MGEPQCRKSLILKAFRGEVVNYLKLSEWLAGVRGFELTHSRSNPVIREFGNMAGVDRAPCAPIPARQTERPDPALPAVGAPGDAPHVSRNIEPIRSYSGILLFRPKRSNGTKLPVLSCGCKNREVLMDRITRCPKCGKRMVPVVTISGRTDFQCIGCDDPAVKWAESSPTVPEKPIMDNGAVICVFETRAMDQSRLPLER